MTNQHIYSIVEARNNFANLIHQAETEDQPLQVTRRGKPVAVILSQEQYEQLTQQRSFAVTYADWRKEWKVDQWEDDDPFSIGRNKPPADKNAWD